MVRLLTPAALASCPMLTRPAVSSTIFAVIPVTPCRHPGSPRLAAGRYDLRAPRPPPAAAPDTSRIVAVRILYEQRIRAGILDQADPGREGLWRARTARVTSEQPAWGQRGKPRRSSAHQVRAGQRDSWLAPTGRRSWWRRHTSSGRCAPRLASGTEASRRCTLPTWPRTC